ncbi:enoyl-CoA hydratase/isomerase family protein [Chachezhania sediminis]|uniref:enoyl-CoA hydratase/isomerase family protein n=1 Tax=Chachezhania sediminis TaxID=2599291 RepID=UPI00131D3205|nr:enoyl-CoA hydratase-related protein [Chachezhania sediminis]
MAGVEYAEDGGLVRITLNRPDRRNALTAGDWLDLCAAARRAARSTARAVLLQGAGGAFSAGFDISEIEPGKIDALDLIDRSVNPALRAVRDIPVPTIAAVDGACVGGGLGIAAACDIVMASERARFGAPYVNIGIMADAGLHVFLRDAIGYQRAAYLIMSGRILSAAEAQAMGLCAMLLPSDAFDAEVESLVSRLASGPTQAMIRSKRILRTAPSAEVGFNEEARLQDEVFATADASEGIDAFIAGRQPNFRGQ